jgi:hypothetical protein
MVIPADSDGGNTLCYRFHDRRHIKTVGPQKLCTVGLALDKG